MTTRLIGYVGWIIILSVSLYFVYNNALHYFSYNINEYGTYFWPKFAPWLLIHIVGGMTALLLGPFQFIPAIRKKYTKVHRTMGKVYLCSIVVAAIASLCLSVGKIIMRDHEIVYGTGLAGLAVAWLLTSGMAYWSVRNKNFVQHREWMVKSYVVTTAFASFRLIDNILEHQFHMDPVAAGELMAWVCWTFPLLITEAILQGSKIRRGQLAMTLRKR